MIMTDTDTFPLWKENKLDQEYSLSLADFKPKFFEWVKQQKKSWLNYYGTRGAVGKYIGDKELLNSVAELPLYDELAEAVRDEFWKIVEAMREERE